MRFIQGYVRLGNIPHGTIYKPFLIAVYNKYMAKKKIQRKITVKSPKIGGVYFFRFAGTVLKGSIIGTSDSLTKHHNEKYFTILSNENELTPGASTKYPVSIRDIGLTYNDVKYY